MFSGVLHAVAVAVAGLLKWEPSETCHGAEALELVRAVLPVPRGFLEERAVCCLR